MYGCVIWRGDVCMGVLYGGVMCVWVCYMEGDVCMGVLYGGVVCVWVCYMEG